MKVVRLAVFFCFIFFLAAKSAHAQNDYVVTKNRDTIRCDIKTNMVSGNIKYRQNGQDKYIIVDTANIIQYYTAADSSTYVLMKAPGNPGGESCFLNWIEKGKINLYELQVYSAASGAASGTRTIARPTPMPMASTTATAAVART